jgi:hypothetical protein
MRIKRIGHVGGLLGDESRCSEALGEEVEGQA